MTMKRPKQQSFEFMTSTRSRPLGSRPSVCRKYHRALWIWLAENPTKGKWEWPKLHDLFKNKRGIKVGPRKCFPCEVAEYKTNKKETYLHCRKCPIKAWRSIADGYSEERTADLRMPCEVVGPYARWSEQKENLDKAMRKLYIVQAENEEAQKEIKAILHSISVSALAVAALWGDSSLNQHGYNTNI